MVANKRNNLYKLFSSNLIIKPLWFLYTYAVIGVLGEEDFGSVTILIAVIHIATQFFDLGLVNRTYVLVNDLDVSKTFQTDSIPNLLLSFRYLVSIIALILSSIAYFILPQELTLALVFGLVIFVGLYITQQYRVLFRAYELFSEESLSVVLERILVIVLTVDLFFTHYGFDEYIMRYGVAYVLFWGVLSVIYHRKMGIIRFNFTFFDLKRLIKQGGSMYVNNIILSIRQRLPYFILERIAGRAAVGIYSSAYRFVESYMFIPNSIVQVGYARFSRNSTNNDPLVKDVFRTHLTITGATLFSVIAGMILIPFLIEWVLGNEFMAYLNDYRLALLIFIPNGSYYLWTSLTNVLHIQHIVNKLYVFNISFLIISQFYFYHQFGVKGSIISILISEFIMVFEYHIAISKKVKLIRSRWVDLSLSAITFCAVYFILKF